jgi:hypothetical protein
MSAVAAGFYVTGGTLQRDAPSYVERQADQDLYAGLQRAEFCYVLTSRQIGKSVLPVSRTNSISASCWLGPRNTSRTSALRPATIPVITASCAGARRQIEIGAVSGADRVAVLPTPSHQLPILALQQPAVSEWHHVEAQFREAVGDLQGDVLVKQDRERHDRRYLPSGAEGRRSRLSRSRRRISSISPSCLR